MGYTFAGFKKFLEYEIRTPNRPDQQAYGHGQGGKMDSIDVQSMELGVPQKDLGSVPDAFANVQIGDRVMSGPSSYQVLNIGDKTVTLLVRDDGNKRFLKKPGGLYTFDTPSDARTITVPRAYFVKMRDDQYGGASGAMAGPAGGGGLPPMI